ncbi:MAG: ABC transporter permease [Actinomycetota bacterium]|nr:ABC transporter permease [Actinomycetota bacterium]
MLRQVGVRVGQLMITMVGITTIMFLLMRLSGDPSTLFITEAHTAEQQAEIRRTLGLDESLPVQYGSFIRRAAIGDFGMSLRLRRPALDVVLERLGPTLTLAAAGLLISLLVGIPLGRLAATHQGRAPDQLSMAIAVVLQGIPTFLLAILLIWVFAVELRLLPVGGRGSLAHLILPAITLAAYSLARFARLTRSSLLDVLHQDYIRTARSKGLSERVIERRHALRNAGLPIVTAAGLTFAQFISSAVVTETVFSWPGVGSLMIQAVGQRDYPVVQACVFVVAFLVVMVNLLTNISYVFLDPRTRRAA